MKTKSFFYGILLAVLLSSCSSYKKIPYFQNIDRSKPSREVISNYSPVTIQPGDILGISVSSLNPEASAVFNYNLNTVTGLNYAVQNNPVLGYLVDQQGNIQLPLIGDMKVSGIPVSEARKQIQTKLLTYLKEPVVNIRMLNFKVSVIGDVLRPGVYEVQNEKITLPEAIGLAGDLNITALRENVMLIREQDGNRQYIPIDLTSKDLFNSPWYYLKNNDVIYIQPGRTKYATVDRSYRSLSLVLSALSIVAIVLTRNY